MTATIKSVTPGTNNGSTATVQAVSSESPLPTLSGDMVIVTYGNDFYTTATMGVPVATGAPAMTVITGTGLPADGGSNQAHVVGYWYRANTAGTQTVSVTETGAHDEEKVMAVWVLKDADTTAPIDYAAGAFGSAAPTNVAAAAVPTSSDALVLVHMNSGAAAAAASYTTPAPLTEDGEFHVGTISGVYAHAALVASGSTGTFTFTPITSVPFASITIAVKAAPPAGNPVPILTEAGTMLLSESGSLLFKE